MAAVNNKLMMAIRHPVPFVRCILMSPLFWIERQRANSMVLLIGDEQRAGGIDRHAVRQIHRSVRGWAAIAAETELAVARHRGDDLGLRIHAANAVVAV